VGTPLRTRQATGMQAGLFGPVRQTSTEPIPTSTKQVAQVDRRLCVGCGRCVGVCPTGAVRLDAAGEAVVEPRLCRGCGLCAAHCPAGAIHMGLA